MKNNKNQSEDLIITFKPDITPEEEEQFISELAYVLLTMARHMVEIEEESNSDTI